MTTDEVKARVNKINAIISDDVDAHIEEDKIHQDVLRYIASGRADYQKAVDLATEALKTIDLDFSRWYS